MSHALKAVSLAVTILLSAAGIALAVDPSKVPPPATKQPPPAIKPPAQAAPFWFLLPTPNAKIVTGTGFIVKLKATTPPPGVYLQWERNVSNSWQPEIGPTGASWGGSSELEIPVAGGFFIQPANYRVRATWDWRYYTGWRNFQVIPKATLQTLPTTPPPSR
ncbi:MAG: hypothetical protein L0191_08165 [Acidobacteria bacterium]|nr:hypothetical protein [Acidobacteriota bacterium]